MQFSDLFASQVQQLAPARRAALSSFAARSLQIAALQGDFSTLQVRHATGSPGLAGLSRRLDAGPPGRTHFMNRPST
ncbi:hypothetical protein [Pseudomonas sp. dw_358]|uniref:hypothetical protein n=1 Tax=Pseudomonas sp. dw_358 TaxID=2720083 RepID=UPI001BD63627|nr:hypothetical protein [Pseudomonas sp. dw_358]